MAYVNFSYDLLHRFCMDVFQKFGFTEEESDIIQDVLLTADLYGIESHGMQRASFYHKAIEKGVVKIQAKPEVVFETPVTAVIDAKSAMGQVVSHKAMLMAIEKAKTSGIGIVSVRNSNHYGISGYYAKMACKEGLMGFSCTNSHPLMVPTFGVSCLLGSNPIAIAMPAEPYDFLFDASTSVVTHGKFEVYSKLGKEVPQGWAVDGKGHPTTYTDTVIHDIAAHAGGGILPLGGSTEQLGSHKGYGYAMICEIFSAALSMGGFSKDNSFKDTEGHVSHSFMAINPAFFGDPEAIKKHFSEFLQELRESPKAEGQQRIYTHGEKEAEVIERCLKEGIKVNENTMGEVATLCEYLGMDFSTYFGDYIPPKYTAKW